jgi:mono/diheme cytochrome c family protein
MKHILKLSLALLGLAVAIGAGVLFTLVRHGVSARDQPTAFEALVARGVRHLAVPQKERNASNPVVPTAEALRRARGHFADHCASCHGNDGRGKTTLGQGLYPKAPDMWLPETQSLPDGELLYVIENGIRLTGMPAWGQAGGHDLTESWELVHLIRHLPKLTPDEIAEMESLNPKSRKEFEEEEQLRRFLAGEDVKPSRGSRDHDH